jgi:hypothetical protein
VNGDGRILKVVHGDIQMEESTKEKFTFQREESTYATKLEDLPAIEYSMKQTSQFTIFNKKNGISNLIYESVVTFIVEMLPEGDKYLVEDRFI